AETGAHLWADKFDGALEEVFELQDQITERVVAVVEPSVQRSEIERVRRRPPDNLDAYDLYLPRLPFAASHAARGCRAAIGFLQKALTIDPKYPAAHALAAWCYEWRYSRAGFSQADKATALRHAESAVASTTDDATALAAGGFVICMLSSDHSVGLPPIERA